MNAEKVPGKGVVNIFNDIKHGTTNHENIDSEALESLIARESYALTGTNAKDQQREDLRLELQQKVSEQNYVALGDEPTLNPTFWGENSFNPQKVSVLGIRDGKVVAAVGFNTVEDVMSVLATEEPAARTWMEANGYGRKFMHTQAKSVTVLVFTRKPRE